MSLNISISLDCKIEDLFKEKQFAKFREYCKTNDIIHLHQLESVDFVMFKSLFGVTEDEKQCVKNYWKTLIDIANRTIENDNNFSYKENVCNETTTSEERIIEIENHTYSTVGLSVEENNPLDQKCIIESEVASLISRIEKYYSVVKSYIPTDSCDKPISWQGLSDTEYQIISNKPNLFYKCTAKRFVLVKWVMEEIEKAFERKGTNRIDLDVVYYHLSVYFGVVSFNREKLKRLLHMAYEIDYSDFVKIRDKHLNEYYQATGKYKPEVNVYLSNMTSKSYRQAFTLTPQVMNIINKAFEEEIYELDYIKEISNSEVDNEIRNRIELAKEEVGKDECIWFIKNIEGTIRIYNILKSYIKFIEESEILRSKISQSLNQIDVNNYNALISLLIKAIRIDDLSKENIMLILERAQITYVFEMNKILMLEITNEAYKQLIYFIKWLCQDKRQLLKEEFSKLFKSDRTKIIVKMRASGITLEDTGKEFGITRERVRQIEVNFHDRFRSYVSRLKPHFIISAFSESKALIKYTDMAEVFGEMTDIFIYCLKECRCATVLWAERLQGFIVGDVTWYGKITGCLNELPEMIEISSVDSLAANIAMSINTPLDIESIKRIIINEYKFSGKVYLSKRIHTNDMYLAVLNKYYNDGIKLYDDFETERFRGHLKEMFGVVNLPVTNRAIDTTISRMTVLCDRGRYILPDRIKISTDLLEEIRLYISKINRSIILFSELYERFKNELLERSNVTNRYFLQGVLKYYYPNDFYYTRDTLSKDNSNEVSIRIAIEEFVKQEGRIVSKDELKQEFAGITDAILSNALSTTHDLLTWDYGQYVHSSLLNISEEDYRKVNIIVEEQVSDNFATDRKLFDVLYMSNSDFITKNNIHNHISFFSVIMYMFPDKYEYRRPYISQKGSPAQTKYDILKDYLNERDLIKISELKEFCDIMQIRVMTIESLLDILRAEFIRVDADLFMKKNSFEISEDVVDIIDDVTESLMMNNKYISLKKVKDFFYYPDVGVEWTQFLLGSIICEYSKKFKIVELDYKDYRYVSGIIVHKESEINTYEEILRYALKHESENMPFKKMDEVEKWLKEQELILKSMPQRLLDKGIINESEHGVIIIQ